MNFGYYENHQAHILPSPPLPPITVPVPGVEARDVVLYHGALSLLLLIPHTLHLSHTVHHNLLHYIEGLGSFYLLLELVHELSMLWR